MGMGMIWREWEGTPLDRSCCRFATLLVGGQKSIKYCEAWNKQVNAVFSDLYIVRVVMWWCMVVVMVAHLNLSSTRNSSSSSVGNWCRIVLVRPWTSSDHSCLIYHNTIFTHQLPHYDDVKMKNDLTQFHDTSKETRKKNIFFTILQCLFCNFTTSTQRNHTTRNASYA